MGKKKKTENNKNLEIILEKLKEIDPELFDNSSSFVSRDELFLPGIIISAVKNKDNPYIYYMSANITLNGAIFAYIVKTIAEVFMSNKLDLEVVDVFYMDKKGKIHVGEDAENIFFEDLKKLKEQTEEDEEFSKLKTDFPGHVPEA